MSFGLLFKIGDRPTTHKWNLQERKLRTQSQGLSVVSSVSLVESPGPGLGRERRSKVCVDDLSKKRGSRDDCKVDLGFSERIRCRKETDDCPGKQER